MPNGKVTQWSERGLGPGKDEIESLGAKSTKCKIWSLKIMNLAYAFTLTVICLALLAVAGTLFSNEATREILRKRFVWVLAAIALAGLLKYPFDGKIFSGLEYEDAFIYNAAARFSLGNSASLPVQPFLTASCSIGSLAACKEYSTYSGHVIGYSAVIAGAIELFGYHPELANFVSFFASILCAGVLFITALLISNSILYSTIAVLIFDLLPFQNLFATASVVEPFSSLFVSLSLLSYLVCVHSRLREPHLWQRVFSWGTLFLVWWACILIKRENALSLAFLPSITVMLMLIERRPVQYWSWLIGPVFAIWIVLACFYIASIDVAETIRAEVPDVGGFPFSPLFLSKLLPVFISTLFDWKLFFFLSVFLPIAVYVAAKRTPPTRLDLYPIILFGAYLLIYSLHYRSYYFIRTGDVAEFDTYRYLAHLIPLYALFVASGIQYCWIHMNFVPNSTQRIEKVAFVVFVGVAIFLSWMQSSKLRTHFSEIEATNRLDVVHAVLKLTKDLNQPYAILTDDVLLYQIWGNGTEFMIDLRLMASDGGLATLTEILHNRTVYYVKKPYHDEPIERNRYLRAFQFLETLRMEMRLEDPGGRFTVYGLAAR